MSLLVHTQRANGWERVKVGKALRLVNGRAFKPTEWKAGGLPIIRIQNLNNSDAPFNYYDGELPEKFLVSDGDLLFAWSGTPGTSFGAHIWRGGKAWLNQHIFKVLFDETEFDKRFLQLAINENLDEYIRAAHGAAGLAHITKGRFEESELPKPGLQEQRAMVAEVEKQFTRLEAGVAGLRRVEANLKRYRAAVLKAACEGKLVPTEAELARQEGRSFESGAQLLDRILTERRQKWSGKGKYKEPAKPDTTNLPELPTGWTWARLDAVASLKGGITVDKNRKLSNARSVPYLRVANVQRGYLDLSEIKEIEALEDDIAELRLLSGDILFTEGGDRDKLGRGWIWQGQISDCIHQNHVFRARLYSEGIEPKFVSWWGNSFGQTHFLREGKQTTNLASINLSKLSQFPIPFPPTPEQQRIVADVERRLSVVEELEAVVNANLQRATRLRQAILYHAFTGQLTSQVSLVTGVPSQTSIGVR